MMKLDKIDRSRLDNKLDLMNADGLDESIMNAVGDMTANFEYSSCCGVDGDEFEDADGDYEEVDYSNGEGEGETTSKKVDIQQIADTTQTAANIAQSVGTIASSFKPSESRRDKRALRRELKAACGRRPIFRKRRQKWQECADKYLKTKNAAPKPKTKPEVDLGGGGGSTQRGGGSGEDTFLGMPKTTGIIVAVVGGLALIGGGIFLYKKMIK